MRCGWLLMALLIAGCDRDSTTPTPAKPTTRRVEIKRVTPLPPDRATHIAVIGGGQIYWVQEADGGRENVFAMSEGGLPFATRISNLLIAEALGQPNAAGTIESLAAGPEGRVYFYFSGGDRKRQLAAFGYFIPGDARVQIIADTPTLAAISGMGNSLNLARGSVLRAGNTLWLWLRHHDAFAMISLEPGAKIKLRFDNLRGADTQLTATQDDLSPGVGEGLVYLDRKTAKIWRIDPRGEASLLTRGPDLTTEVTAPVWDGRGRMTMFAPEGTVFKEPAINPDIDRPIGPTFPALVIFDGEKRELLDRDRLLAPSGLNVRQLKPQQLQPDRGGWLGYDAPSGELLRFSVVDK